MKRCLLLVVCLMPVLVACQQGSPNSSITGITTQTAPEARPPAMPPIYMDNVRITELEDKLITATVKVALAKNPDVSASTISADTTEGTVQLSGTVKSEEEKKKAESIARGVDGVKVVENKLKVLIPPRAAQELQRQVKDRGKAGLSVPESLEKKRLELELEKERLKERRVVPQEEVPPGLLQTAPEARPPARPPVLYQEKPPKGLYQTVPEPRPPDMSPIYMDDTALITELKDKQITANVRLALAEDPDVRASTISVDTTKGTVQLRGTVESEEEKKKAESIARGVDGVKVVENKLTVIIPPKFIPPTF